MKNTPHPEDQHEEGNLEPVPEGAELAEAFEKEFSSNSVNIGFIRVRTEDYDADQIALRKLRAECARLREVTEALLRAIDNNTGYEPSASVYERALDEAKEAAAGNAQVIDRLQHTEPEGWPDAGMMEEALAEAQHSCMICGVARPFGVWSSIAPSAGVCIECKKAVVCGNCGESHAAKRKRASEQPSPSANAVEPGEGFYLMENRDGRKWIGNSAVWWAPKSAGYTCDLNKAGVYTDQEAEIHRKHPDLVTVVPVSVAKSVTQTHCDHEAVNRALETYRRRITAQEVK